MADFLEPILPGDDLPTSHREWNAYKSAARAHLANKLGRLGGQVDAFPIRPYVAVSVLNSSGSDVDRFEILGLGATVAITAATALTTFQERPIPVGATPAIATHFGRWCVTLEPIKNATIGLCALAGVIPVQVNIIQASDDFCDVTDADDTQLTSRPHGAGRILYRAGASGTQWCAVEIGYVTYRFDRCTCVMKGVTGSGSKASCTVDAVAVIAGDSPLADPTDATEELSVYNAPGWRFEDNAEAKIEWNEDEGRWEIYELERQARFITFSLGGALTTSDASVTATVTGRWDGTGPSSGTITLYNVAASSGYIFEGASGAKGIARLNEVDGNYYIVQLECP